MKERFSSKKESSSINLGRKRETEKKMGGKEKKMEKEREAWKEKDVSRRMG